MTNAPVIDPCSCAMSGWCERHQMRKGPSLHRLCQEREDYRALWDNEVLEHPMLCSRWIDEGGGKFVCERCSRPAMAHCAAALPRDRSCIITAQAAANPANKKCGGCGGGSPVIERQALEIAQRPVELPPIAERLKNFAGALVDFVQEPGFLPKAAVEQRLAVCGAPCDRAKGHFCTVCGCWLPGAAKTKSKHCPMGKWPGDDKDWLPLVQENWLKQTLVAVIHYGDAKLTRECVRDCLKEPVRVLVIDNQGNYPTVGDEAVLRLPENVGWGAACNIAIKRALADEKVQGLVLLNNDVRLSPEFVSGMIVAQTVTGAAIVAASYNVGWNPQRPSDRYSGPAESYQPRPKHKLASHCDGTAVLIVRELLAALGELDLSVSPQFGWGLMVDYALRAKELGQKVAITEAAYVYHHGMKAAEKVHGGVESYITGARAEFNEGIARKWGTDWQQTFSVEPGGESSLPSITMRNLIYHITPFASNDVWLRNVKQLLKRIGQFNGRRVVAIATSEKMVAPDEVKRAFGQEQVEFLLVPNDRRLRERASFTLLMDRVASTDRHTATFYAHAKGVATAGDARGVTYWRNAMYHKLLDDPDEIGELLQSHACVGTHRLKKGRYPDGLRTDSWHFAGTFFWFRNDSLFTRPDWRQQIPDSGWGVEAYPGIVFDYDQSACVFMDEPSNSYDPDTYELRIEDDEESPAASDAVKVEIGGGRTPKGNGYINVDRLDCADVKCDFDAANARLPFDDDAVSDLYASHCLEHITHLGNLMREIVRVCRIGARVEIRVPHWLSNMAMCHGHIQTITHEQVDHWDRSAIDYWWGGMPKRLKHFHTEYIKGGAFDRWRKMLPQASEQDILELCPDACHESVFVFHVVGNP